jgi:hypothetical protein
MVRRPAAGVLAWTLVRCTTRFRSETPLCIQCKEAQEKEEAVYAEE